MRLIALICILACVLEGCSAPSHSGSPTTTPANPTALRWGVIGLTGEPTLDPALASDATSISVTSLVYGGLVRLDRHLQVQPDGASRWRISRDGKVYTFTIRPGLRFASGRTVTAGDFAAALQRALGPEGTAGTASMYLDLIAHRGSGAKATRAITALDSRTLRITLEHPAAHFLAELALPASFVPDSTLATRFGSAWTDHAAGFGPYSVRIWRHSRSLTLQRNPYYYGGHVHFRTITIRFLAQRSALTAYSGDSLDLVSGLAAGDSFPGKPVGLQRVAGLALDYLAFNTSRLPFKRLSARRAFGAEWSPAFARSAMGSTAFPAAGLLPTAFNISVPPWKPSYSGAAYLVRAGFTHGAHFPPVTLVMPRDTHLQQLGDILHRTWLRSLGVNVTIRQLNPYNYDRVVNAGAFDLALVRWGADYPDPQDFLGTQLGATPDNVTGWVGTGYTRQVQLADSYNPADPRRLSLLRKAAVIAVKHLPIVPMDEPAQTALVRPGMTGIDVTALGTIAFDAVHARFKS